MRLWFLCKSVLRNLFHRREIENQLDDELKAYLRIVVDERVAAGMPVAEARRTAMAEFGGIEQVKQTVRDNRAGTAAELIWQDVRYALRQLRRNRGFTLTAVITMGLGIGATTAIFSAVCSLLLRPLPYPDANQIMSVSDLNSAPILDPDFVAARAGTRSFQQLAGFHTYTEDTLTGIGDPMRVTRAAVTADFFTVLGVIPALGRNFYPDEDWSGGPNVLMLSDHLWRNKFNADPEIVGRAIKLDGTDFTVIGVLPRHSIARLRPGVTAEQAEADMQALIEARAKDYPPVFEPWAKSRRITVEPLQRNLTGDNSKPLYILLACVAAVLLISCANVTNLQLARAVSRKHETAVRGALGASRVRLIRQFLIESLVLSTLAAVLGLAIASVVTFLVRHAGPLDDSQMPSRITQVLRLPFGKLSATIQIDGWVLAFTVGLAVATTLTSGLVPAISGSRADLTSALASAGTRISSGRGQRFFRHSLLVIEVGLALLLLACAGLLVRSFVHVMTYDSGFDASNMLTGATTLQAGVVSLKGPSTAWSKERYLNFADQLLLRLKALPGVRVAALTTTLPLDSGGQAPIAYDGTPIPPQGQWQISVITEIALEYFRAVGTPVLAGRAFNSGDNETSPRVAIVNSAFAKRFFAGEAVGKRFKMNDGSHGNQFDALTIVGVVENVRHGSLERDPEPEVFRPMTQGAPIYRLRLALRTSANAMRHAVTSVDARQPVFDIETMDQRVSDLVAQRRLIMLLILCFAMLAVVLPAVGVYGVFAYSVTQRGHEMGIRLALGSSRIGVLRLVVTQAAWLIGLGGVLGLGAALGLSKLLASLLVGVTPHDPISFSVAWVLMTTVALLASAIPASQAARTNLIATLHSD